MKTGRVLSPAGTSAQRMLRRIAHIEFTGPDLIHRDLTGWCEQRPSREHAVSTIVLPESRAKCLASQLDLVASLTTAADIAWRVWMDGPSYEDAASEAFESEQDSIDQWEAQ